MTDGSSASSAPAAARVTVYRTSPEDARQRQVILSLDDQRLATLLYGQHVSREITAGRHRLRANNTLVWKTIEFEAAPGADLHFTIVNRAAPGMLGMIALLGAGPMYVTIDETTSPPSPAADPA